MSMVGHPMLERLQGVRPMPATKEDRRRAEAEARAAAEAAAPAAAQVKRRPCPSKEYAEHSCRQLLKARRRYRRPWWSPVAAGACLGSCLRSPSRLCLARPAVGLGVVMQVRRGTHRDPARAQCGQQHPAAVRLLLCRVSRPLHAQHLPWNGNGRLPGWVATSFVRRYWTAQGGKPGARTAARRRAAAAAAVEPGSEDGAAVAATGKRGARKRKQAGA